MRRGESGWFNPISSPRKETSGENVGSRRDEDRTRRGKDEGKGGKSDLTLLIR